MTDRPPASESSAAFRRLRLKSQQFMLLDALQRHGSLHRAAAAIHVTQPAATHLLRQPPDYPQALALPLPLHLAGLGQQYVLPTRPEGEADPVDGVEAVADPDPATTAAAGLALEPEQPESADEQEQLALFGF